FLKGAEGDAMNILMVAAGHNLRKLLNWLRQLFVPLLPATLVRMLKAQIAPIQSAGWQWAAMTGMAKG
ncbi:MAG: hypothetical protein D6690_06230, partial [Nitrospirae bacterium]